MSSMFIVRARRCGKIIIVVGASRRKDWKESWKVCTQLISPTVRSYKTHKYKRAVKMLIFDSS
jgi:hypothetical protein